MIFQPTIIKKGGGSTTIEEVDSLPTPTIADVGRYVKYNGDVYECKEINDLRLGVNYIAPKLYFDTTINPLEQDGFAIKDIIVLLALDGISTDTRYLLIIIDVLEMIDVTGYGSCWVMAVADSKLSILGIAYIDWHDMVVILMQAYGLTEEQATAQAIQQFNEMIGSAFGITISHFGWQTDFMYSEVVDEQTKYYIQLPQLTFNVAKNVLNLWSNFVTTEKQYYWYNGNSAKVVEAQGVYIIPPTVNKIGEYAFAGNLSLTQVTIPNSVTSIGVSAFSECSSLTSVTIPDSVTSIGVSAFEYCSSLTSVTIPNSVTSIDTAAFYNCSSLTSVTIGNGVTRIGESAFYNCSSLTSVIIGNSVTSIDSFAFSNCSSLTLYDFTNCTSIPTLGTNVFNNINATAKIVVPDSLYDDWIVATNWSTRADYIYKQSEYQN